MEIKRNSSTEINTEYVTLPAIYFDAVDENNILKQVHFSISKEKLSDYLAMSEDFRSADEFLATCSNDEICLIHEYASNDGLIVAEETSYCDDFYEKYNNFVQNAKSADSDITEEDLFTKEEYYDMIYLLDKEEVCEER